MSYDISQYTDSELYDILDLVQPSDRVLEAKIVQMINKYNSIQDESGKHLAEFFRNMYTHFFSEEEEEEEEGFQNIKTDYSENEKNLENEKQNKKVTTLPPYTNKELTETQIVHQLEYTKDRLNPILKQTIKRIISIDSQYRDQTVYPSSTEFTFNLSEPLRDVLALRLFSVQIPQTWYTMNSKYGGNFFYLKGNSPGIDNESFDYTVSINAGSYTPNILIDKVNTQLQNLKTKYTDVSFGRTNLTYDSTSNKSNLTVDITNIFNETNYAWSFESDPSLNAYPLATDPSDPSFNQLRYNKKGFSDISASSLSAFLGFNDFTYYPNCIQSNRTLPNQTISVDTDPIYNLDSSNNYFEIVQYQGVLDSQGKIQDYVVDNSINTIKIQLTLTGFQTRNAIVNDLSGQIYNNPYLIHSSISRIDISDNKQDAGFSFFRLTLNLNKSTTPHLKNVKTCVKFPTETGDNTPLWVDTNTKRSCFQFPSNQMELNVIKGESIVKQSNYIINKDTYFVLKCKTQGYRINDIRGGNSYSGNYSDLTQINANNSNLSSISYNYKDMSTNYWNDYKVTVPKQNYSLTEYTDAINAAIKTTNTQNTDASLNPTGIFNMGTMAFVVDTAKHIRFRVDVNKYFTTKHYKLDFSGTLLKQPNGIDFSMPEYDLSNNTIIESTVLFTVFSYNVTVQNNVVMKIKPNGTNTNAFANEWVVRMTPDTYTLDKYISAINRAFDEFSDISNSYPLQGTKMTIVNNINNTTTLKLSVNILKTLTQNDYELYFYDASYNANQSNSSWNTYFDLDNSYNIASASTTSTSYTDITSDKTNESYRYYLPKETYITISPRNINGLNINTLNPYTIIIPQGSSSKGIQYTLDELFEIINNQFKSNNELYGSYISTDMDTETKELYVILRLNINKIYTASDYKVVFYDFTKFVNCSPGKKLEKATKDTTLGWLLGFRYNTEYDLKNFFNFGSSFVIIDGDTAMTSNLYNYFLISLDDYIQNHLNDGLVTLTQPENFGTMPSYATRNTFQCTPSGEKIFTGAVSDSPGNSLTQNQVYSANQIHLAQQARQKQYSLGPYTQDLFALIPLKLNDIGTTYVDFGGTMQNQERMYFGPVNIHRMTIKLITDKGDTVDLNNNDWSFSFICEQLYNKSA